MRDSGENKKRQCRVYGHGAVRFYLVKRTHTVGMTDDGKRRDEQRDACKPLGTSRKPWLTGLEAKERRANKKKVESCGRSHPAGVSGTHRRRGVGQNELVDAELEGEDILSQGEGAEHGHEQ